MRSFPAIVPAVVAAVIALSPGGLRAAEQLIPPEAVVLLRPLPLVDAGPGGTLPIRASGITVRHNKTYYTDDARPQALVADAAAPERVTRRFRFRSGWQGAADLAYAPRTDTLFALDTLGDAFAVTSFRVSPGTGGVMEIRPPGSRTELAADDVPTELRSTRAVGVAVSADATRLWLLLGGRDDQGGTVVAEFRREESRPDGWQHLASLPVRCSALPNGTFSPGGLCAHPEGLWLVGSAARRNVILWLPFGADNANLALAGFAPGLTPTGVHDSATRLDLTLQDPKTRRSYLLKVPFLRLK